MSTFCSNHQLISSKKHHHSFKELDLPPRREQHQFLLQQQDMSPPYDKTLNLDEDPIISDDEDELDPYSSDYFRMYEFKVRRCTRRRSHDWTDCPFAHPGEKARRRDPKRYCYSGSVCPDFRRGGCSLGDSCEFAHGVFECWLHPSRYRTEACKDGKRCNRKVCFFAHTPRQLRIPCRVSGNHSSPCCCLVGHSVSSPTSTLLGMSHVSPPMSPSPPLSPAIQRSLSGFSQASRCSDRMLRSGSGGVVSYKDVLSELMSSLEAMNFDNKATSICSPGSSGRITRANSHWVDASFVDDQQFILSPSTPSRSGSGNLFEGSYFSRNNRGVGGLDEKKMMNENGRWFGTADPDLGWVNDLLM